MACACRAVSRLLSASDAAEALDVEVAEAAGTAERLCSKMCIRDSIKAKQEARSQVCEKMDQAAAAAQQAAGAQPGPDAGANNQQKPGDDGVVDADFKDCLLYTSRCV